MKNLIVTSIFAVSKLGPSGEQFWGKMGKQGSKTECLCKKGHQEPKFYIQVSYFQREN